MHWYTWSNSLMTRITGGYRFGYHSGFTLGFNSATVSVVSSSSSSYCCWCYNQANRLRCTLITDLIFWFSFARHLQKEKVTKIRYFLSVYIKPCEQARTHRYTQTDKQTDTHTHTHTHTHAHTQIYTYIFICIS